MAAQVISLARWSRPETRDWSNQELAEFYRVESALSQAGLALESERGLSDEGDPWFVFCRTDTGEVFIHFARVGGEYVVDGGALPAPARGGDFGSLVAELIRRHPLAVPRRAGSNIHLHPAALLIALVGAAFFHSGHAKAAELGPLATPPVAKPEPRRGLTVNVSGADPATASAPRSVVLDAQEVTAVLAGVSIGVQLAEAAQAQRAPAGAEAPLTRAAMMVQAAIGSVDFAVAQRAALSHISASSTQAALTVMAVLHDLAPVNVAPSASAAVSTVSTSLAAPALPAGTADTTSGASTTAVGGGLPPSGASVVIHLAEGAMPVIAALALVQADGALRHVGLDHVVHVASLPAILADAIARGEVITLGDAASVTADPSASHAAADANGGTSSSTTALAGSANHAHSDASSVPEKAITPVGGGHADDPSVAPIAPSSSASGGPSQAGGVGADPASPPSASAAPDASPTAGVTPVQQMQLSNVAPDVSPPSGALQVTPPSGPSSMPVSVKHDTAIDVAIDAFTTSVKHVTVLVTDHGVVFYDPDALGIAGQKLDSVTWVLEDGSSVSLIGTVSELHGAHGVGA